MNADINVAQTKSVSITFATLRILHIIFSASTLFHSSFKAGSGCPTSLDSYSNTCRTLSLVLMALTLLVLLILWCCKTFLRILFYIYYAMIVISTLYLTISSSALLFGRDACQSGSSLSYFILFSCLIINLTFLCVFMLPFDLAIKCVNLGGCFVWPLFLFTYQHLFSFRCYDSIIANIIAWAHLGILLVGFTIFTVLKLMYKTTATMKVWRIMVFVSLLMMVVCYVLALLSKIRDSGSHEN